MAKIWHSCDIIEKLKRGWSLAQLPTEAFIQAPTEIVLRFAVKPNGYHCGQVEEAYGPRRDISRLTAGGNKSNDAPDTMSHRVTF